MEGGDLSRGARQTLVSAQRSMEDAVYYVHNEMTSLQAQHADLQSRFNELQYQHEALKAKYQTEADSWREFKVWWKAAQERKRSSHQTPSKSSVSGLPSSPLMLNGKETTPRGSTETMARKRKAQLSETEMKLLDRVGLDYSGIATARSSEPRKLEDVDKENDQSNTRQHSSESPARHKKQKSLVQEEKGSIILRPLEGAANSSGTCSEGGLEENDDDDEEEEEVLVEVAKKDPNRKMEELKKDSMKNKGRGRYSAGIPKDSSTSKTINAEFEIDTEQNGNVNFLHKAVVRDKAERKRMHAYDCECCSEWYNTVGDAPLRRFQDPRTVQGRQQDDEGKMDDSPNEVDREEEKRQIHRQIISRHRDRGPPALTPPGYWDVTFPNTQRQEEINKQVREEYKKRPAQISRDPRFKRRSLA